MCWETCGVWPACARHSMGIFSLQIKWPPKEGDLPHGLTWAFAKTWFKKLNDHTVFGYQPKYSLTFWDLWPARPSWPNTRSLQPLAAATWQVCLPGLLRTGVGGAEGLLCISRMWQGAGLCWEPAPPIRAQQLSSILERLLHPVFWDGCFLRLPSTKLSCKLLFQKPPWRRTVAASLPILSPRMSGPAPHLLSQRQEGPFII